MGVFSCKKTDCQNCVHIKNKKDGQFFAGSFGDSIGFSPYAKNAKKVSKDDLPEWFDQNKYQLIKVTCKWEELK